MVDCQRCAVEVSPGDLVDSFLERGARDAKRIDRIRLPALARGASGARHVLGSDSHDPPAAGDQEPLKRAGQAEWRLIAATHNLMKLHRAGIAAKPA